jgi:hypothetical protein
MSTLPVFIVVKVLLHLDNTSDLAVGNKQFDHDPMIQVNIRIYNSNTGGK